MRLAEDLALGGFLDEVEIFHCAAGVENRHALAWLNFCLRKQLVEYSHADGGFGVDSQALELGQAQARRQIISHANEKSAGNTSGQAARCVPFGLLRG